MLKRIKDYIVDNDFKINVMNNKVNIVNYTNIITIEKTIISIKSNEKKIIIRGKNMFLRKLLESELLIIGDISSIELE